MEYFEVIKTRRSTRSFEARPVEEEKLRKILDAANIAPSAGNLQAYEIHLVRRPATLKALVRASRGQAFVAQAPVALVFFAHPSLSSEEYGARGASLYATQDATIACMQAWLAATDQGLASVWVGAFDDDEVRVALGVGTDLSPVAILPIGYAGEHPGPTSRRPLKDLVHEID